MSHPLKTTDPSRNEILSGSLLNDRAPKRRSIRACKACRAAKTKCEVDAARVPCRRCQSASIPCIFLESRRGRIKGSKNLRSLERLLNRDDQTSKNMNTRAPVAHGNFSACSNNAVRENIAPNEEINNDFATLDAASSCRHPVNSSRTPSVYCRAVNSGNWATTATMRGTIDKSLGSSRRNAARHLSGRTTPFDPHNLMIDIDEEHSSASNGLPRALIKGLCAQFPVSKDKDEGGATKGRKLYDPLLSIVSIANSGWGVDDEASRAKRQARQSATLPNIDFHPEDARLLEQWTPKALQEIMKEQSIYFEHGLYGCRRDVAPVLDPVKRNMITEPRVEELFQAYWELVHPLWAMLDPSLHTISMVQNRSALLMTTILALGSTALATLPDGTDEQVAEALHLHAHAEKLNLVVYTTGARSIEIIQAQILLSRWGISRRTHLDEQRWIRAAVIPRMASEIGLNLSRRHKRIDLDVEKANKLRWNDLRTRAFMINNEYRFFTFSGRELMELSHFELEDSEVDEITRLGPHHPGSTLPAFYHLYLFDREVRRRIVSTGAGFQSEVALEANLHWIESFTQRWIQQWCPQESANRQTWHLVHDALGCQLLLSARLLTNFPNSSKLAHNRRYLLRLSTRIFREALELPHAIHMTHRASLFPFAAAIILKLGNQRDLILRVALRMAGTPGKPFVPTFVRDGGNQLLSMLCANHFQADAQLSFQDDDELPVSDKDEQHAGSSNKQQNHSLQHLPFEPFQTQQPPTDLNHYLPELDSRLGLDQFSRKINNANTSVTFSDAFNFPCNPDLTLQKAPLSLPYLVEDYDAILGLDNLMGFGNTPALV